jgi:hypothetical protein
MTDLANAAQAIDDQLALANSLVWQIDSAAHSGQIVSDGTIDAGLISNQMVADYNNAYQAVLDASYLTASDVLELEAQNAIDGMHTAIDDLVAATSVLATVSTVADMVASANTTQEQLQAQQALNVTDMTVDQADVDNFNNAAAAVQTYAQAAAAYTSAASNSNITSAIDSYASANNVAVASYTAVSYTQNIDQFIIEFGTQAYLEFNGAFTDQTKTVNEIWQSVGYTGG